VSVCLVWALTLESLDLETSFFVFRYTFRTSRSRSRGQGQGHIIVTKYTHAAGLNVTAKQSCLYEISLSTYDNY